jgi:hypothetical protein
MKYVLSLVLTAVVVTGLVVPAEAAKPIAVGALTSHQTLEGDTNNIGDLAKVNGLPTWFASMLKLYDEGMGANGLDTTRPWGVVVQLDDELSAYGFIPVTDAEYLLWDLEDYIERTDEVGWEVYKVIGTEPGKQLFARVTSRWVYVADTKADLDDVASDPAAVLDGMDKKYDAAISLETKNIPAEEGRALINLLGEKLGPVIRRHASEEILEAMGDALFFSEQVTMGWVKH